LHKQRVQGLTNFLQFCAKLRFLLVGFPAEPVVSIPHNSI
jgi:hypothetical protein